MFTQNFVQLKNALINFFSPNKLFIGDIKYSTNLISLLRLTTKFIMIKK